MKKLIFSFSLIFASQALAEGGWGSSGGGSGVACYKDNTKKEMISVVTLDYWDWQATKPFELFTPKSTEYQGILKEVDGRISMHAPLFIYRLRQASHIIEISDWSKKTNIPKINDANPVKKLPENCELVQIAARYHRDAEIITGNGPTSKVPEVRIDFNKELFDLMDPLNQAILVLHEQMYMMGKTIGHHTSDDIRPVVMRFFEKDLNNPAKIRNYKFDLRIYLSSYFGDYILYFSDIVLNASPLTQESRFNSFMEMIKTLRKRIHECSAKGTAIVECKDFVIADTAGNLKWLTDEMAFMFYTNYILDMANQIINSELIIAPLQEENFRKTAQERLTYTCQIMRQYRKKLPEPDLAEKAQNYCSSLGL
jgi:hypothetical protein